MLYTGFNELELKRITEILDRHNVHYSVSVPGQSMDFINDPAKRVDHRFMDNLLQVEIETVEFDKIPANDIQKLFDLRVYKEEESPFTDDELETSANAPAVKKPDPHAKINQVAALCAIGSMALFFMWKQGFFK